LYLIATFVLGPQPGWQKSVYRIALIVIVVSLIIALFGESLRQRKADLRTLETLNEMLDMSQRSDRVYYTEKEKQLFIDSLQCAQRFLQEMTSKDSLYSLFIGQDEHISEDIIRTNDILNMQLTRYSYLNTIMDDSVAMPIHKYDGSPYCKIIPPDTTALPVLNIGLFFYPHADSVNFSYVRISVFTLSEDSLIFKQFCEAKEPISAFIIPNRNDPMVVYFDCCDKELKKCYRTTYKK
jgi:hypothetical protein